jgi:O-antigen ligase
MSFTTSQYLQLIAAAGGGIIFFIILYSFRERAILAFLILFIPFQLIESQYGTLNTILVFLAAGAFLLQGRISRLPMAGAFAAVLFAFLLAFTQSHPAARSHHFFYLIGFVGNFLLFYLVYNFIIREKDWQFVFGLLIVLNILVAIYTAIQFVAGDTVITLFGINEFYMLPIRGDGRLTGPFKATAATAEYFVFQNLLLAYLYIKRPGFHRVLVGSLFAANFVFLVATGNRGGFITFVLGGLLFLYFFRREIGIARVAKFIVSGGVALTALAIVIVNYSDYGMLFGRLEETSIEGGVPDTRVVVWPKTWRLIQEKPFLGHGPDLFISLREAPVADIPYLEYPHSLPLHVLYTTGIVGLLAWTVFFWILISRLIRTRKLKIEDSELAGVPALGLIVLVLFLISQIRIEFLREGIVDYQNYLFVLFALFVACSDLIVKEATSKRQEGVRQNTPWLYKDDD